MCPDKPLLTACWEGAFPGGKRDSKPCVSCLDGMKVLVSLVVIIWRLNVGHVSAGRLWFVSQLIQFISISHLVSIYFGKPYNLCSIPLCGIISVSLWGLPINHVTSGLLPSVNLLPGHNPQKKNVLGFVWLEASKLVLAIFYDLGPFNSPLAIAGQLLVPGSRAGI